MLSSFMLLLLHVFICGSLSCFRNIRHYIFITTNSRFRKVSQTGISICTYYRPSFWVVFRNSWLAFILRLFRYHSGPCTGRSNIDTIFILSVVINTSSSRPRRPLRSDFLYLFIQEFDD